MKILITGGTGFVGRHLIETLANKHDFVVLTRDPERAAKLLPGAVSLVKSLTEVAHFDKLDAIINLAGEPIADKRWTALQRKRICDSRWDITRELVARIRQCATPPAVFISGSAIGYYGRQGQQAVTEQHHQVHHEFTHQVCHKWEQIALEASEYSRVCLLRTGVVLAKGEGALAKMALPFKLGLGGKMGDGEQYFSWIHIDDMVRGIIFLLENDNCEGPFNMTAPEPVTNKVFTATLAASLHRPAWFTVPAFVLKIAMGDAADMLLTGQQVLPAKLSENGFAFNFATLRSALEHEFA